MTGSNTYLRKEILKNAHINAVEAGFKVESNKLLAGRVYPLVACKYNKSICFDFIENYINEVDAFDLGRIGLNRDDGVDMLVIVDEWESTMYMYDIRYKKLLLPMTFRDNNVSAQTIYQILAESKRHSVSRG